MIRILTLSLLLAAPALAAPGDADDAKAMLKAGIGFATVKGRGQVPAYADWLKSRLVAGGFAPGDIVITPAGETARLHLVWKGSGKRPPLALAGHMDVVEANPRDWTRDPFTAVEEGGFVFGRGASDNKFDTTMIAATLIALKRQGFKPGRDIHFFLSGDEETSGATAAAQAAEAKAAGVELLLNGDSGGGLVDDAGKPLFYSLSGAEKSYADYALTVTDPGGHSSRPTGSNAIAILAAATAKVAAYQFPAEISDITRASLRDAGTKTGGALGAAMLAFVANPKDTAAIATLRASPDTVGQIGTTCVPTMVSGGHAENALPQKAVLNVNCRIWPGVGLETVRGDLERVVADPRVKVALANDDFHSAPPSPLRPDVVAAVTKAVATARPGVVPVPGMDAGASDSLFYRAAGIPSYGVSGLMMRGEDVLIHGLNERVPVAAIAPALVHWRVLITEMAK
ncbi:hypothetical protein IP88_09150 [alpha proteobacterium AAP81b]|nr:hypothetical protein IP88_09150 [alpha proteobacterium AAP81b]